jgi:hypothetical protein
VDSQVDDKDLRKKCRHMKNYNTLDFGIDPDFCLMKTTSGIISNPKPKQSKRLDESLDMSMN